MKLQALHVFCIIQCNTLDGDTITIPPEQLHYVDTCPQRCIYMYITMQFFSTATLQPSNTLSVAHGI